MLDKTLKQLQESDHKFLNIVIDALPVPVIIKDNEGTYPGCNSAFEDFIGMSRDVVATTDVFVKADTLITQADEALYNAKAAGRNCVIQHAAGK